MTSTENLQQISILVVEDEDFQRHLLCHVLKHLGFRKISEAESGQGAMKKMDVSDYSLILSDVQMPGVNGLELLRRIRTGQTPARRDTRFIILTSISNTEVLGTAMALDVNGFLVKPMIAAKVMEKIHRAIDEPFNLGAEIDYQSVTTDLSSLSEGRLGAVLAQAARSTESQSEIGLKQVPLLQLREGMRVAKNLVAKDGTQLIPAGRRLTESTINRLRDLRDTLAEEAIWVSGLGD